MCIERNIKIAGASEILKLQLQAGSFFGEAALLNEKNSNPRRNASVRATDLCHLFVLSASDFSEVIHDFPEYKHVLKVSSRRKSAVLGGGFRQP